ncbi:MAG TPA: hypothetical protein VHT52_01740 [Stellaceae bacterium]|jgi:hypothetical protein|nr:hypothetical protein [Stellaceae bacterium]
MPRALTDEEWAKVAPSIQAESGSSGGGDAGLAPPVQSAVDFGKGAVKGLGKGAVSMIPESAMNLVGMEGKKWKDWSGSPGDPTSMSERVGEWTGDIGANVAPFMLMPELGVASKLGTLAAKVGPRAAKWGSRLGDMIEGTAKGAFGGGSEAFVHNEETKDPNAVVDRTKRGAETGGVTSAALTAGRLTYEALPHNLKTLVKAGATLATGGAGAILAIDEMGGHHWIPHWMLYGIGGLGAGAGAAAFHLPPTVAGAGAERAAQGAGYEQTDKTGYSVTKDDGGGDYIENPSR